MVRLECEGTNVLFGSDLGRPNDPIMLDPAAPPASHYLVVDSTYGDRQHEMTDVEQRLAAIMTSTPRRGGAVLVPTFAVGRAQAMLFHLACLKAARRIPDVPVYLDSPMTVRLGLVHRDGITGGRRQFGDLHLLRLCFFRPRTQCDWRSFGAFSGFLVALFAEMCGVPITIHLLSGWLQSRHPTHNCFSHDVGHLVEMLFGCKAHPHSGFFHILSFIFIGWFVLISVGWKVLYEARCEHRLATTGTYAYVHHPQYVGFIMLMLGFLLQWPTLLTFAMFVPDACVHVRAAGEGRRAGCLVRIW
jgi:protein-S-isoprenylcysteine O-methyltransferase Ste14